MRYSALLLAGLLVMACDDAKDKVTALIPDAEARSTEVNLESDAGTVGVLPDTTKDEACGLVVAAANNKISLKEKCNFGALAGAASAAKDGVDAVRARCKQVVDSCHAVVDTGGPTAEDQVAELTNITIPNCPLFKGETAECTETTTEDLETCLNDFADAISTTVSGIDCDTLTPEQAVDKLKGLGAAVPDTDACGRVTVTCPGVFGDTGAGAGGNGGTGGAGGGTGGTGGAGGAG